VAIRPERTVAPRARRARPGAASGRSRGVRHAGTALVRSRRHRAGRATQPVRSAGRANACPRAPEGLVGTRRILQRGSSAAGTAYRPLVLPKLTHRGRPTAHFRGDVLCRRTIPGEGFNGWREVCAGLTQAAYARPFLLDTARGARRRQPRPRSARRGAVDLWPANPFLHRQPLSTRVVTRGVDVIVNVFYKHSRIKEYLKEGRALRIETVCNSPTDLGCNRRLHNLPELQAKAVPFRPRSLSGSHCPRLRRANEPEPLRFGDPRTMALVGALCIAINAVAGFTNRSLRAQVAGFLASNYTVADDLRPPTPETQRPDPARSTFQHVCAHLRRRTGGHLFTPRSTSAYCAHCSPLIIPPQ